MDSGIIGIPIGLLVLFVFWLLSRTKAFHAAPPENVSLEELAPKYAKWDTGSVLLGIPLLGFLVWFYLLLFQAAGQFTQRFAPPGEYRLFIQDAVWWVPAILLAFATCLPLLQLLYLRLMGPEKFAEFQVYSRLKTGSMYGGMVVGLDTEKLTRVMGMGAAILTAILVPLMLDYYLVANEKGIQNNLFFSFGAKTYPWSEVTELVHVRSERAPNGNPVRISYHEIRYRNGFKWSSETSSLAVKEKEGALFSYFQKQTGKKITVEDPFPNALPPEAQ